VGHRTASWAAAALFAIVGLNLTLSACGGAPSSGSAGQAQPPLSQRLFRVRLLADDKALDRGMLKYQAPRSLATGAGAVLTVQVTDLGRHAGSSALPRYRGWVVYPDDVPTGAILGVRASCRDLACAADSATRQSVLVPGESVGWSWQLSAQAPGTAHIWLVATTYDQNSNISLHETQPIEITVVVTATPGYWATKIGNVMKAVIGLVGFGALVTAAGWIWRRLRKKKQPASGPGSDRKTPSTPSSA
jgi:hypothetical protein